MANIEGLDGLQEVKIGDESLFELEEDNFLSRICHLIVLYNSKSGGKRGTLLGKEFARYGAHIFDMHKMIHDYINIQSFGEEIYNNKDNCIITIAGGDGSITWGCSLIDSALNYLKVRQYIYIYTLYHFKYNITIYRKQTDGFHILILHHFQLVCVLYIFLVIS